MIWSASSVKVTRSFPPPAFTRMRIVPSAGRTFNPATNNTVTIDFAATTTRYVRINISANTGWPAAQLSEVEVYGTGTDTTPPSAPANLAHSTSGNVITLNWGASSDTGGSGLAGYNVYRGGSLIATLGAVLSYQDTQPVTATVSYFVRARDGAGNLSGNSNTVTRNGSQPPPCVDVARGRIESGEVRHRRGWPTGFDEAEVGW